MSEMSFTQDSLKTKLGQLECHFTWELKKEDLDLNNLLNRLEEQVELDLGREQGVARTHNSLGFVKFLCGLKEEALSHLLRSEVLINESLKDNCDKTLIVTYGNFAWLNYHMENYTECESYLQRLQKINEKFHTESSSVPEVLGEKGWTFLKFSRKYYDRAKEVFVKALELEPGHGEWNAGYAIALYRTETESSCKVDSPAIKQLRQAIDITPDNDVLRVLLGLKLLLCSKTLMKESEKLVEEALNGSPENPHVMRYVGIFFRDQGSIDRSVALLKKGLESSPNSCFIHHQLALCYKNKKLNLQRERRDTEVVDEARDKIIYHMEKATSLKASFIIAMSELALQYAERGDLYIAEELFEKTFKTATEIKDHLHVVHFHYAQYQQYSTRQEDLAIQHYKESLAIGPHTGEGTRSAQKLMKIAQRRIKNDPNDWKANEIVGLIYQVKGEMWRDNKCHANASSNEEDDEHLKNLDELIMYFQ
ncbi:interferon-induced protein with tetratricopeptide repeats 5-like [Xyrauchen texanus]|uniref:interferon-induced protein with tetratricopeptide repeats 5-like n=1 Tax=Xyrauchen texanus TaxID=154827 RepID=UPI00224259DF|nr:interferon-induced protein with tetratricopeptide repeats 5-like [Xyrauchen texanus]